MAPFCLSRIYASISANVCLLMSSSFSCLQDLFCISTGIGVYYWGCCYEFLYFGQTGTHSITTARHCTQFSFNQPCCSPSGNCRPICEHDPYSKPFTNRHTPPVHTHWNHISRTLRCSPFTSSRTSPEYSIFHSVFWQKDVDCTICRFRNV